jgi:hypothetical protein
VQRHHRVRPRRSRKHRVHRNSRTLPSWISTHTHA